MFTDCKSECFLCAGRSQFSKFRIVHYTLSFRSYSCDSSFSKQNNNLTKNNYNFIMSLITVDLQKKWKMEMARCRHSWKYLYNGYVTSSQLMFFKNLQNVIRRIVRKEARKYIVYLNMYVRNTCKLYTFLIVVRFVEYCVICMWAWFIETLYQLSTDTDIFYSIFSGLLLLTLLIRKHLARRR